MQPKSFKPKLSPEETSSTSTTPLNTLRNALTTTDSTYSIAKGLKSPQASGPVKVVNLHETAAEKEDYILQIVRQSERTDEDAWSLYQYLKDYKFFNLFMKMTNELYQREWLVHVFKKLKYERFSPGQAIVTEGDPSNGKMYIILTGEVLVMVKKIGTIGGSSLEVTKNLWDSVSAAKKLKRNAGRLGKMASMNAADDGSISSLYSDGPIKVRPRHKTRIIKQPSLQVIEEKSSKLTTSKTGKETENSLDESLQGSLGTPSLTKLKSEPDLKMNRNIMLYGYVKDTIAKGGYFGERALEATNLKRSASIVAQTDCDLLVLEKAEYDLIKRIFQNRTKLLLNFVMDNLPGLDNIHSTVLFQNYVYLFEEKTLGYKSHLFHEGDHGDKFYLIYNGSCEIYRTIIYEEAPIVYSGRSTNGQHTPLAQPRKVREKIVLSTIKEGGVVGEGILYMEDPTYSYSVQATSDNCKVLAIDKASFILKFTQETFNKIRELYNDKKLYKTRVFKEKLEQKGFDVKDVDLDSFYLFCKKKVDNTKKVLATSYQEFENKSDLINSERPKLKEGAHLFHNIDLKPIITSPRTWETSITTRRASKRQNISKIDRVFSEQDIKEMFSSIKKSKTGFRSSKSPSISTKLSLRQGSMESVGLSPLASSKTQYDFSSKLVRAGTLETLEENLESPSIPKLNIMFGKNMPSDQESTTLRKETTQASTVRNRKFYTPHGSMTFKNEGSFGNDNKETNNSFELESPRVARPLVICRTERNMSSSKKVELPPATLLSRAKSDPQEKKPTKKEPKKKFQLKIRSTGELVDLAGKNYTVSSVKEKVEQKKIEYLHSREDLDDGIKTKKPLTLRISKSRKVSQEDILSSKRSSPLLQKVSMEACFFSGLNV